MTRIEFIRRQNGKRQKDSGGRGCDISQIEQRLRKPWPRIRKSISEALGVAEADLFDADGWPLEVEWSLPKQESIV